MRKNLSLALVVALLFTISATTVWGSPMSWKKDFSDLTGPIETTEGYSSAYRQQNAVPVSGVMKCEPAAGMFQKEGNDISFKMEYDGSKVETSVNFNPNVVIDPASADKTEALKISADEKIHYRTAFALGDKNYSDFGFVGKGILENGKVDFTSGNIMNVGKENIKVFNYEIANQVIVGRWYVIDQVYYYDSETQENKVDVYLDGVSVLKNLTYSPAGKEEGRFTGFAVYRFNMNVDSQARSAIYFDDLEINVMGINEEFQPAPVINSPIPYSYLKMFDFNESADGSIEGLGKANMSGVEGFTNTAEAGVYGKAGIDKAAKFDYHTDQRLEKNFNPYYQFLTSAYDNIPDGSRLHIKLQFAMDELRQDRVAIVGKALDAKGEQKFITEILNAGKGAKGYALKILNKQVCDNLQPKTWYMADILIDPRADNLKFQAYLNGADVTPKDNTYANANGTSLGKLRELRLDNALYSSSKSYFDNFGIGILAPGVTPDVRNTTVTSRDSRVYMSETDKNIYLGQNQVTVDEFMQSLNIPDGAVAQLTGQGGMVKSEGYLAIGDYLRVENSNTQNFYLVSPIKQNLASYDFDGQQHVFTQAEGSTYGGLRISKFGKDHITGLASGKGGRLASDSMIEFASPNYKDATYGNSNNRDPYYEFGGISGQAGDNDKIVISASILPMDYGSRRVIQSNAGGNWMNPVAFEVDGTINIGTRKPGQQDLKIKYTPGKWYELTTVLTPGSRDFDFYINGEKIDTSTVQIGENDKVVACPDRVKFGHSMQSATGSSYTYFDNFHVYIGDYDPAPSKIGADFQADDRFSVNETDRIITITGDLTVGQLKSCINTGGAVRVYTNSGLTTQVADDQPVGTYILLITSANERGTELYTMLTGKTNIKNAGGLEFDNGARTITVMPDTPAEKLAAMIETYGAVVSVVDQAGQPATGYVTAAHRLKLTDPADASNMAYYTISLKDKLFSENFNNYSKKASYGATGGVPSGFFFGANKQEDGNHVYVEGVEVGEGNRAVKFHSENAANDYQISVEKNFDAGNVKGTVVVETSIKTSGAMTDRMITNRGVYVDGKADFFSAFINLDRNGNIVLMGRNVGKYVNDRWYRFVIVYDMDTNVFKGFIDGVQVYQGPGTSGMITSVINIRMQQNTIAGAAASETYFDDFRFYNVYNTDDFDTSGITTEIKASQFRVVPGADPSLRAAWNQKTIADIFGGLEIGGAEYYAEDQNGTKLDENTAAANGIRIVVKSADGLNVAKYTLDDSPYYAPITFTDGTDRIYKLGDGTVKAVSEAQIFTEDSAKTATLVIAQYEGDRLIKIDYQSVTLEAGAAQPLEAALNITAAGTRVKGMLLTDLTHLIPLCVSETIS